MFALSFVLGIVICTIWAFIYQYMPKVRLWSIEIFPSLRIHFRAKVLHVHHWFFYPVILIISVLIESGFLTSVPVRGYLTGAILKEFFFPSRKRSVVPRSLIYKSTSK